MTRPGATPATRLAVTGLFAVAMAFVESAVVVYLRALYYPRGFELETPRRFLYFYRGEPPGLLPGLTPLHVRVEIVREAATLLMLVAVAWLAGAGRWQRAGLFFFVFGLWDVFYYVFLKAIVGWPPSLGTIDLLFLIPLPWVGPVWLPLLVSVIFVVGGARLALVSGDGRLIR